MTRWKVAILAGAVLMLSLLAWPGGAQAMMIERVSVATDGTQGNQGSGYPSISADGRYVAFESGASTLVPGDGNNRSDIFVYDRQTGTIVLASVSSAEAAGNDGSWRPSLSADGHYVAFVSYATNLVGSDTNGVGDIFVRDLVGGTTQRVSVATNGTQADAASDYPSISADGHFVAFQSDATTLVVGDTNAKTDIFLRDVTDAITQRVSVATGGTQATNGSALPSISGDGRYVAFQSNATNLIVGDTNACEDIFMRDRTGATTRRVSVADDGSQADGPSLVCSVSADGTHVAFESYATNLVTPAGVVNGRDVYVRDIGGPTTVRASAAAGGAQPNDTSRHPSISGDGGRVAFYSYASNLVAGDTNGMPDVFLRDLATTTISRASVAANGTQADGDSNYSSISADGRYLAFESDATNLVPGDTNHTRDVFVVADAGALTYDSYRGSDRYDTAIKLSQALYPAPLPADSGLVLAPGETFPEALCGAPLAAAYGGPVLLTYKTALANNVKAEIVRLNPKYVFCIGLSTATVSAVRAALPITATVTALNGAGTSANIIYDMSRKVADALKTKVGDMSAAVGIVTRGDVFPDAIGVSPLACAKLWPIILTNSGGTTLHSSAAATIAALGLTQTIKVGTYAAMPAGVTGVANLSGTDRYVTNANVANWAKAHAGLAFTHIGLATGDKFPDALASGPFLAADHGILLLSPLLGPVPAPIATVLTTNKAAVQHVTFIACIEPVIGQVKALVVPPPPS